MRIPFSYIVPPEKRIRDFSKTLLKEESSGILNWMMDGCLSWQKEGLEPIPSIVKDATEEYKSDSTPVRRFVSEEYETGNFQVACGDFYNSFVVWWKSEMGEIEPVSKREVGLELKRMGFETKPFKHTKYYVGLKPKKVTD